MTLTLNGDAVTITDGWTVGDLVRGRSDEQRRVAVARNGEVVPKGEWETTVLAENDLIELLAPVAGG
jgi:sulfur carrier protein